MHVLAWKDAQDIFNFFFRKNFTLIEKITKTVEEIPTNPSLGFSKCWHSTTLTLYFSLPPSPHLHWAIQECERVRGNVLLSLNTVVCTEVCFKALFKEGCIKKKEIRGKTIIKRVGYKIVCIVWAHFMNMLHLPERVCPLFSDPNSSLLN